MKGTFAFSAMLALKQSLTIIPYPHIGRSYIDTRAVFKVLNHHISPTILSLSLIILIV